MGDKHSGLETVQMNTQKYDHSHEHNYSHEHDHSHEHNHSHEHDHSHALDQDRLSTHTHVLEDGTVISHRHGEGGHHHSHVHTKSVLNRLAKASGHMKAICRMVEDGRSVQEVLPQLMAVKSAINNTGKIILEDHIKHCVGEAMKENDTQSIAELKRAIRRFSR